MIRFAKSPALVVALVAVLSGVAADARGAGLDPAAWQIGPVIRGESRSRGMPLNPSPGPGGGFQIALPGPGGSLNYVTFSHGSLTGKRRIVMRYRIEAAPGVQVVPRTAPQLPAQITLYFQRRGDNWSGRGPFEAYRWYATFATQSPTPGEHRLVAPLSGNWTAVQHSSARTNPAAFGAAVTEADQVGFVLGGGDGYGHGVFATGPARLVVTEFKVE
jgi:hypothetical protein